MTENSAVKSQPSEVMQLLLGLTNAISDAAILLDRNCQLISSNQASRELADDVRQSIFRDESPDHLLVEAERKQSSRFEIDEYILWVVPISDIRSRATLTLLDVFLKKISEGFEPHRAMGYALQASLAWRWAAVCKVRDDKMFEIQTWMEEDKAEGPFEEQLEGTACKIILDHERFIYFNDVAEAFDDEEYSEMGAKVYAGLSYQVNNLLSGHIFAMNDSDAIDVGLANTILNVAAELLGNHLTLKIADENASVLRDAARTDSLTGVFNRHALDDAIQGLQHNQKLSVAVIDLDGMKSINDRYGHQAGDELLVEFSLGLQSILHQNDRIFRIGGDEFVVLIEHEAIGLARSLSNRLNVVANNLKGVYSGEVGASVGLSTFTESEEDFEQALKLADERMYANKRQSRLFQTAHDADIVETLA